jgi:hypothetical protein
MSASKIEVLVHAEELYALARQRGVRDMKERAQVPERADELMLITRATLKQLPIEPERAAANGGFSDVLVTLESS